MRIIPSMQEDSTRYSQHWIECPAHCNSPVNYSSLTERKGKLCPIYFAIEYLTILSSLKSEKSHGISLVVQWPRLQAPSAGSIPGQGPTSHMPQLKIPQAAIKTRHSSTNKHHTEPMIKMFQERCQVSDCCFFFLFGLG